MGRSIRPRQSKTIDFYGIGLDGFDGTVEAIAAVTGVVDQVNERVLPGAFAKTIADRRGNFGKLPLGIDHSYGVGITTDMQEVGRADLPADIRGEYPEATGGLYCKGQVVMSDSNIALLRRFKGDVDSGKPVGSSFVYEVFRDAKAGDGVRDLLEVGVYEWTIAARKAPVNPAARVTGVKAMDAAKAIAGSYEDLAESIMDAVRAAGLVPPNGYGYVVATFPGYAIVCLSSPEMPEQTLRIDWVEMSGQIVLGQASEVEIEQVVVPAVAKAVEVGALTDVVNRYSLGFKAGRMFSQANLDELDAALKALQKLWDRATATRTEDTGSTGGAPTGDAPAAKAVEAATDPRMALQALGWDLAILETRAAAAAIGG